MKDSRGWPILPTGMLLCASGLHHFKPLHKTILQYSEHKEFKSLGNGGQLRKIHIGKEADKIEDNRWI
jgi:hypothetical protein